MNEQEPKIEIHAIKNGELTRQDHMRFSVEIERLIKDAEELRLSYMKRHQARANTALSLGLCALVVGASGFGWFLLVQADLVRAIGSITLAIIVPIVLNIWSAQTLKNYAQDYKTNFLPRMAQALGGLQFNSKRGIGAQFLPKTGIVPGYAVYEAEDCFLGTYKGTKIIFSEARLLNKNRKRIFHGLFVLLEIPNAPLEGHTIITADSDLYNKWRSTRWGKLQDTPFMPQTPEQQRFKILSDAPQTVQNLINQGLIKELSEIADLYENARMSVALFRKKFIFMTIPYARAMFEPSSINLPIATRQHALHCKREIEQLLEIIDVLDLYTGQNDMPAKAG